MMGKYRRIGREVEAVQYTGTNESRQACLELAGINLDCGSWALAGDSLRIVLPGPYQITLDKNSWLVKDEDGPRYYYGQDDERFLMNHEPIKE